MGGIDSLICSNFMPKKYTHDTGSDIVVPHYPDFSRIPILKETDASYRTDQDIPPRAKDNPYYLAIPGPRTMREVQELMAKDSSSLIPDVRSKSPVARKEFVDEIDGLFIPLSQHIALEEMVMSTIRNAFSNCYLEPEEAVDASRQLRGSNVMRSSIKAHSVGSGCFLGPVGIGKSTSIKRILMGCGQTIVHSEFRGRKMAVQQVAWIYLSMPPKASASGLLRWILSILDRILKTTYREEMDRRGRNGTANSGFVMDKLALHAVGVIVLDEFQNIEVGSVSERHLMEMTLQEMINCTTTRWIFVGTRASVVTKSEALVRRMSGERGQIIWDAMPFGPGWIDYVKEILKHTVTCKETPFTEGLAFGLHRLCDGNPSNLSRLITTAQANIIGHSNFPDEQLSLTVLEAAMKQFFPEVYARTQRRHKYRMAMEKKRKADAVKIAAST